MLQIDFDSDTHRYTVDGDVWPSVTQVLAPLTDFSRVPPETLERARNFGTAVHAMIDLDTRNDLDEDSLDEPLRNVLAQYRQAMRKKAWAYQSELRLGNAALKYAGTADMVASDAKGRIIVVDVKTGAVPPTVGSQTAAYAAAWLSMRDDPKRHALPRRECLALTETSFKWHKLDDPSDWSIFLSALNIYRFKEQHHVQ